MTRSSHARRQRAREAERDRRRRSAPSSCSTSAAVAHVLANITDRTVILGPLVTQPDGGPETYFIVSTCGPQGWRCDQIKTDKEGRTEFMMEMLGHRPLVVHDMADELQAAKLAESLWPDDRISAVVKEIEVERQRRLH